MGKRADLDRLHAGPRLPVQPRFIDEHDPSLWPGRSAAHLPNMPADEGNIQISSIGDSTCKIADWHAGTGELIVNVHCYLPDGTPADEQFKLLYTDGTR